MPAQINERTAALVSDDRIIENNYQILFLLKLKRTCEATSSSSLAELDTIS